MKLKPYPEHGYIRKVWKFALFPVVMDNGDRIWLESYYQNQEYVRSFTNYKGTWYIRKTYQL